MYQHPRMLPLYLYLFQDLHLFHLAFLVKYAHLGVRVWLRQGLHIPYPYSPYHLEEFHKALPMCPFGQLYNQISAYTPPQNYHLTGNVIQRHNRQLQKNNH